jgi:hypothetical protein
MLLKPSGNKEGTNSHVAEDGEVGRIRRDYNKRGILA